VVLGTCGHKKIQGTRMSPLNMINRINRFYPFRICNASSR
jgi:hypothetical protein